MNYAMLARCAFMYAKLKKIHLLGANDRFPRRKAKPRFFSSISLASQSVLNSAPPNNVRVYANRGRKVALQAVVERVTPTSFAFGQASMP